MAKRRQQLPGPFTPTPRKSTVAPEEVGVSKKRNKSSKRKGKGRKGKKIVSEVVEEGSDSKLTRLLRFGQIGVGTSNPRKAQEAFNLLLAELRDKGVPLEAIEAIEKKGVDFLRDSKIATSITKLAGRENTKVIRETLGLARAATKGIGKKEIASQFDEVLKLMKEVAGDDPLAKRAIQEIAELGPETVGRLGANTTVAAIERRGADPALTQLYKRYVSKAKPSPVIGGAITDVVKKAEGGALPKVGRAAASSLGKAGLAGVGGKGGLMRALAKVGGKSPLGLGISAAILGATSIPRALQATGRGERAQAMGRQGFAQLGPASSMEFLKSTVEKQEAISRRRMTMQAFEPEMFQQVIGVLSGATDRPSSLTTSERRIGSPVGENFEGRKSAKQVQFLLDQLMGQMGNLGG